MQATIHYQELRISKAECRYYYSGILSACNFAIPLELESLLRDVVHQSCHLVSTGNKAGLSQPCGLNQAKPWKDLQKVLMIMSPARLCLQESLSLSHSEPSGQGSSFRLLRQSLCLLITAALGQFHDEVLQCNKYLHGSIPVTTSAKPPTLAMGANSAETFTICRGFDAFSPDEVFFLPARMPMSLIAHRRKSGKFCVYALLPFPH